ncbi:hypothetical protein C8R44DRAFT_782935 [Mycena epipterygia]|nr:hypothetical protein C8R44DRAFT_782935 [Mycena epipterygia]
MLRQWLCHSTRTLLFAFGPAALIVTHSSPTLSNSHRLLVMDRSRVFLGCICSRSGGLSGGQKLFYLNPQAHTEVFRRQGHLKRCYPAMSTGGDPAHGYALALQVVSIYYRLVRVPVPGA